jgi:hypothetical protein
MKKLNDLPKESQEALLNGASMFIAPIKLKDLHFADRWWWTGSPNDDGADKFQCWGDELIPMFSLYKTGDEVCIKEDGIMLMSYPPKPKIILKATIKDVKVIRVKDLSFEKMQLLSHNGNYEDNPYVFLYEIERIN